MGNSNHPGMCFDFPPSPLLIIPSKTEKICGLPPHEAAKFSVFRHLKVSHCHCATHIRLQSQECNWLLQSRSLFASLEASRLFSRRPGPSNAPLYSLLLLQHYLIGSSKPTAASKLQRPGKTSFFALLRALPPTPSHSGMFSLFDLI